MIRDDLRSKPVNRLVVMGESNAYGMSATQSANQWVQALGNLIREFQDAPLRIFNNAIPSNVISPEAPGYRPEDTCGTAPAAIERYEEDMIGYRPDLAVYAYGLNDSRCGHETASFMEAYREIVSRTRAALPGALVVLVGPYWNPQYDAEVWSRRENPEKFGAFSRPGDELVLAYNEAIAALAEETGCLFVDVYRVLEGAPWLVTKDDCHFNDLGQRLIGMTVFAELAARCSFLARGSRRMERELGSSIWTTGGTDALPHVIDIVRKVDTWKG